MKSSSLKIIEFAFYKGGELPNFDVYMEHCVC